jgi:hypothetical protein
VKKKILVIVATKFNNTPEADKVFRDRNWGPVKDNSTTPKNKKLVNNGKHSTSLIELLWEEWVYE